jgi:hypothetical protein
VFQNLGVKQGLPAMEVYNLFQDHDGYVWVFTEYGMVKHNGSTFVPTCRNLPLKESVVYSVATSRLGEMYISNSKAKIYKIRNDKAFLVKGLEKYTRRLNSLSKDIVNIQFDKRDKLYFSSFEETYILSKNQYCVPKIKENKRPIRNNKIQFPYIIRSNNSGVGSICLTIRDRFGHPKKTFYRDSLWTIRAWAYEFNGNDYVSFANEMHLDRKNGTTKNYLFEKGIINFRIAPNGHVWVGLSNGGLLELDSELNLLEHYLNTVTVSNILFDDQSGMWVSTIGEGVYYCPNTDHLSYQNIPELQDQITALNTIDQKLFIGTASGNLFVRENHRLRKIDLEGNIFSINDVIEFEDRYYVGTKKRTFVLNPDFKLIETIEMNGYAFHKAQDGSLIMISASCILRKERNNKSFELLQQTKWNRCVVERYPGEFFVIMYKGDKLYRMRSSSFSCPSYLKGIQGKSISRIKIDSKKNIWICTKGEGLYCLTIANKLIHYSNLPSKIINDVSFLSDYIVLLSTNKGAFASRLNQIQNKASWQRLLDEEVLRILPVGNEIMIATSLGITSLSIDKLFRTLNYRFYLSSVEIDNRKIPLSKLSQLNYKQNDLYFNYDLLAYGEPLKQLDYTLEGPSRLHGRSDGTQIHLQNLAPGQYTLSAFPDMNGMHGNELKVVTTFYIKPAFWQTSLFLAIVILIGLVLTFLCSWLIMKTKRRKETEKMHIEKLLAEYRLTALKAQVNPHFMSNSLVAIQELIIRKETSKANQYLAKFSMLLRYLLDYSDQSVTSLHNELKVIELYVELEQLRFTDRFQFIRKIDENVQMDQLFIPALITQPLIENAIWHGLLPLSDERIPTLTLSITLDEKMLCISISDNGVGRTDYALQGNKPTTFKKSKGMKLIEKRIENLNKLHAPAYGSIEFIDCLDEDGNPIGSTVHLIFSLELINKLYHEKNQESYY